MKKSFITMVTLCLALSAWAADVPKQGFGIQIGWAQPVLRLNSMTNPSSAKDSLSHVVAMKGFKVGVVYDASFIKGFGTSLGINYTFGAHTGSWQSVGMFDYPRSRQMFTYHEVEVFVDWQYKFEVAKETYLMLYTGPTIQCGLGLNMRADRQNEMGGDVVSQRYSGYDPNADANNALQRLNVTWGIGAGFQYKRYFLRGGYDFGLINPYRNADFSNGWHTRGRLDQWQIKIGMYLWYADN
ncbi:MAG: outer membrane beta-barrel protein [Paludibacteraceae bacterium]|nr:outer membrane beta-barrel protein [Paludibacteraceae bacterium]